MLTSNAASLSPIEAHILAENHKSAGRLPEAEGLLRQLLMAAPNFHPAWHTLGLIAYEVGKLPLAVELIAKAISIDANVALYHRNIGEMCRRLGRLEEAVAAGQRATVLAPHDLDAHYNFGLALTDKSEWEAAIRSYRRALELNPKHGLSWNNLGAALEKKGDMAEAEAAYAKAVELNPAHHEAQNNLGAIYSEQGKLDEASRCFDEAIKANPDFSEAHFNLSSLKTYREDDPHLLYLERNLGKAASMPAAARIRFWFALGKAREDVGRYDEAFAAYAEGNRLQHELLPCDEARSDDMLERVMAVFTREFFAARSLPSPVHGRGIGGEGNKAPIFIVGMPRSGTTLLEQILSSHPAVYGAGELLDLNQVIMEAASRSGFSPTMLSGSEATSRAEARPTSEDFPRFPDFVPSLSAEDFARMGDEYRKRVWKLAPDALRITDKMPANFFYIGMIRLMMPDAKIIHAMRDPMDSCFSNYARLFNDTMEFAYDLGTLGRYYARYITLMQHWHEVLPPGSILDLRYEDMVADTEGQARRILDYVGLPWDDNCLAFHQNKRHVKTASVAQVRKPIYKTSVARWQRFEKHLAPLFNIVKNYRGEALREQVLIDRCLRLQKREEDAAVLALIDADDLAEHSATLQHVRGISLYRSGHLPEALACYTRTLALRPDFPLALNSMGFVLQDMDRLEEARDCFAHALQRAPDFSMARLNLGMVQLKLGDWQAGWKNYEARWVGSAESVRGGYARPDCPLPQWAGEPDTQAQNLLIFTEQGFGDTFMFSRYLSLALQRFARVGFVCSVPTLHLLASSFGDRVALMTQLPADFSAWHWQCPMMSLPGAFGSRPDDVPREVPYLSVPETAVAAWRARLAQSGDKPKIGIAWAGRKAHQYDARRSLQFEQLLPLLRDERFSWVSLQKWMESGDKPALPADVHWLDWTDELADFADTAALVSALDLVITIDSSMAHLAGALGKPVWMMNRYDGEWRWLRRRDDSIWYPTMRIFNQPEFGDWPSVLDAVRIALSGR